MLEAYLGADTFRDGIRGYMKAHAYSNATTRRPVERAERSERAGRRRIAAGWTEQPGFPLRERWPPAAMPPARALTALAEALSAAGGRKQGAAGTSRCASAAAARRGADRCC